MQKYGNYKSEERKQSLVGLVAMNECPLTDKGPHGPYISQAAEAFSANASSWGPVQTKIS